MIKTPARCDAILRMFVSIQLPAAIQACAAGLIDRCRDELPSRSVRWVKPQNIHLTLRFIGNVSSRELDAIKSGMADAVCGARPFSLRVGRLGCFPHVRSPRVLWLGVQGDLEPLGILESKVTRETKAWARPEDRAFHPHLTLGRVVTRRREELEPFAAVLHNVVAPSSCPWSVEEVHLMQSELLPTGSQYSALASFPLVG